MWLYINVSVAHHFGNHRIVVFPSLTEDKEREENKTLIYITCLFQFSLPVYQWPACDSPSQL